LKNLIMIEINYYVNLKVGKINKRQARRC